MTIEPDLPRFEIRPLSQEEGGLHKAAEDLAAMFPERFGTKSMQRFGMKPGQVYSAQQVKLIRREIGRGGPELPLYGDPREALEDRLLHALAPDEVQGAGIPGEALLHGLGGEGQQEGEAEGREADAHGCTCGG